MEKMITKEKEGKKTMVQLKRVAIFQHVNFESLESIRRLMF